MSSYCRIIRGLRGFAETSAPLAFGTRFGPRATAARERGWFCIRGRSSVGERGITVLGRSSALRVGESSSQGYHGAASAPQDVAIDLGRGGQAAKSSGGNQSRRPKRNFR